MIIRAFTARSFKRPQVVGEVSGRTLVKLVRWQNVRRREPADFRRCCEIVYSMLADAAGEFRYRRQRK